MYLRLKASKLRRLRTEGELERQVSALFPARVLGIAVNDR
jgi:hypothetical protein